MNPISQRVLSKFRIEDIVRLLELISGDVFINYTIFKTGFRI